MDKNWCLDKKNLRKVANQFFITYVKIFLIILPILLVLSIFFILVGVIDDPEALDYGIPCMILFTVLFICLLGLYIVQHLIIYKKCSQGKFFIQQQDEKILYKINEEESRMLELYKIFTLKDFFLIIDLNSNNIIIIPKCLNDLENLIWHLKKHATTKIILNKVLLIFISIAILIFALLSILSIKTTTTYHDLTELKYVQSDEMIEKLYPNEVLKDTSYTDGDFYYYNEEYKFLPIKKPKVSILSLLYSSEEYIEVKKRIPISNEAFYIINDYVFYFYGNDDKFPIEFYMVALNEKKNCIIFLGYQDISNRYKNLIEKDFQQFINKIYGKLYDFS